MFDLEEKEPSQLPPRLVFIPGYRRTEIEKYHARNTVMNACARINLDCETASFDVIPLGKFRAQPPFAEMVDQSVTMLSAGSRPTIVLGHCGGGAVALEASKEMPPASLLGLIFLCPLLAPSQNFSFLQGTGLRWLRKNIFASQDLKRATANKAAYVMDTRRSFQEAGLDTLRRLDKEKVVFITARNDKVCSPDATERFARSNGFHYCELIDQHSPTRSESAVAISNAIQMLLPVSRPG